LPKDAPRATAVRGTEVGAVGIRPVAGVGEEASKVDTPSAYVTLRKGDQVLGTYLFSMLVDAQEITVDGKTYAAELRFRRHYKPFQLHLKDFSFKRFVGTETAKDYASVVRLVDPQNGVDREVRIWMNHPLRYGGETYYQSSFTPDEKATILQVVRNPGWLMPYFSCAIVAAGMAVHFVMMLLTFIGRQMAGMPAGTGIVRPGDPPPLAGAAARNGKGGKGGKSKKDGRGGSYTLEPAPLLLRPAVLFPAAMAFVTLAGFLYFCKTPSYLRPPSDRDSASAQFDFDGFARLPINYEGRPMPMESVARDMLKLAAEQETFYVYEQPFDPQKPAADRKQEKRPQVQLLLDFMTAKPERASYEVFRITNQELLGFMNLDEKQKRYSIEQIAQKGEELEKQVGQAAAKKEAKQALSQYETDLLELAGHMSRFRRMGAWPELNVVPPVRPDEEWHSISAEAKAWSGAQGRAADNPAARAIFNMLQAYASGDAAGFNREVTSYQQFLDRRQPEGTRWLDLEVFLRRLDPFHLAMWTYLLAFMLACASWAGWRVPMRRAAMAVLLVTLVFHSLGILSRVLITGRAPVVTLYTSAVVIGWFAILISIPVEFFTRRSIGTAVAAAIGCVTLIIARQLYWQEGDTMRELQAVLDTNFWLWTHVQSVTIGYAATLLAGVLAIVYIIAGVFTPGFDCETRKVLSKVTYGVVCFATLFSFVGTTLGGIWADQSWGRFWGWDPKENGAILIVAWNVIILHARWAGLVRERGIAVLAVMGGIVTGWSWFGTNALGVGLHSYGFMPGTVVALCVSWAVLLLLSLAGMLPTQYWKSLRNHPGP
jgi:ABC-type transport system involved in cytochrome c biogenesis permease subunit